MGVVEAVLEVGKLVMVAEVLRAIVDIVICKLELVEEVAGAAVDVVGVEVVVTGEEVGTIEDGEVVEIILVVAELGAFLVAVEDVAIEEVQMLVRLPGAKQYFLLSRGRRLV